MATCLTCEDGFAVLRSPAVVGLLDLLRAGDGPSRLAVVAGPW